MKVQSKQPSTIMVLDSTVSLSYQSTWLMLASARIKHFLAAPATMWTSLAMHYTSLGQNYYSKKKKISVQIHLFFYSIGF